MSLNSVQITGVNHRFIHVTGIKMHIAEQGEGPLARAGQRVSAYLDSMSSTAIERNGVDTALSRAVAEG
jgi:hypothetical protein